MSFLDRARAALGLGPNTDEDEKRWRDRTDRELIDPYASVGLREELARILPAMRSAAEYTKNDRLRDMLAQPDVDAVSRGAQVVRAGALRQAIEAVRADDPAAAQRMTAQLDRLVSKPDRNVDEEGSGVFGGALGAAVALALTRGRAKGARNQLVRLGRTAGITGAGAAGGALAANLDGSPVTGNDMADVGIMGALGLAAGAKTQAVRGAVREGLRRAGAVSAQRRLAAPVVDESLPLLDRQAAERAARKASARTPAGRVDRASMIAPLLTHQERVVAAAGGKRMITSSDDPGAIRKQLRGQLDRTQTAAELSRLDEAYRKTLDDLGLTGKGVEIDLDRPGVVGADTLRALENAVGTAVQKRREIAAAVADEKTVDRVVAQLKVLEAKRGGLTPEERYAKSLLEQRYVAMKAGEGQKLARRAMSKDEATQRLARTRTRDKDELARRAHEAQGEAIETGQLERQKTLAVASVRRISSEQKAMERLAALEAKIANQGGASSKELKMLADLRLEVQAQRRLLVGRDGVKTTKRKTVRRSKPKPPGRGR